MHLPAQRPGNGACCLVDLDRSDNNAADPDRPAENRPGSLPQMLTVKDLEEVFSRSPRTLRNWVRAGHLHPVKIGGSVFFRLEDVLAMLDRSWDKSDGS